ncbi:MAG: pilus assembly protein PilM [Candidatus Margulisiibacteriota bacterium]
MPDRSILGIDLRVCSVKVVEITNGPGGRVISGWGMEEIPIELIDKHPEKEVAQARMIKQILLNSRIKTREAVIVTGGNDLLIKKISLPVLPPDEARNAIKWKIKDEITYPIENAVFDFSPLKTGTDYIVAVARKDTIDRLVEVMRIAQLRLVSVVPVPMAMVEVFSDELKKEEINSLVYMGRRTTNISFFKDGSFLFNREIPLGGEDITRAMTSVVVSEEGRLELKYEEAEKIKIEKGIPVNLETYPKLGEIPIAHLQAVVRPALEKIEDEMLRTLEYLKGQEGEVEVKKFILTGGSSKTPHLNEFLASGLGIPFESIDPLKSFKIDARIKEQPLLQLHSVQLSAAMGAALSHFEKGINLLPEEIRDPYRVLIRKHLNPREISIACAALLAIIYLFMFSNTFLLKNRLASVQHQLDLLSPKLSRMEALEKAVREEEGRRGVFKTIEMNRINIPGVMEDISLNLPGSILMSSITIDEKDREVRLKGTAFDRGETPENVLSKFILDLSSAPIFERVELVQAIKNEGYIYPAFDFEIAGKLKLKT